MYCVHFLLLNDTKIKDFLNAIYIKYIVLYTALFSKRDEANTSNMKYTAFILYP